jgi:hypothetical protein
MPPETPITKHQIAPEKVMSFFEIDQADRALRDVDFSIHEELRTLVELFRDTDPAVALRAHTQLRKVLKEVADASGLIERQEVTAVEQESGRSVRLTRTASRVSASLPEGKLDTIYEDKPKFAAAYLPSNLDEGDDVGEGNGKDHPRDGSDGPGKVERADPVRPGDV